jgi:hypothetical protein
LSDSVNCRAVEGANGEGKPVGADGGYGPGVLAPEMTSEMEGSD